MSEVWSRPTSFAISEHGIEAGFEIPHQSPWFSGHFPEFPILPGIAMLGLVKATLERAAFESHSAIGVAGFARVRFRNVVRPGERLALRLDPLGDPEQRSLRFSIVSNDKPVADGQVELALANDGRSDV